MKTKTFWQEIFKTKDKLTEIRSLSDKFHFKTKIHTRYIDFDMQGHVNNSVYFTYLEIARTKYWQEIIKWDWKSTYIVIAHAELDFIKPILMDDDVLVHVKTSRIGSSSFDLEYQIVKIKNNVETICSKGKTVCIAIDIKTSKPSEIPPVERKNMIDFEGL